MKAMTACVLMALLGGCAQTGALREDAPGFIQSRGTTPQGARDTINIGRSTKAEVAAALGKATVIPFDSGYEVWVYRWRGAQATPGTWQVSMRRTARRKSRWNSARQAG